MKKFMTLFVAMVLSACSTKYILVDEEGEPLAENEYSEEVMMDDELSGRELTANDVFVVNEGENFVTYQYKSVRVDEISPLASLYCSDVAMGASPYLREVNLYHNGFMRATFDCVNLAI